MLFHVGKNTRLIKYFSTQTAIALGKKHKYEIPGASQKAFYLANASLIENTDWFVHNAFTVIYDDLINELVTKGHKIEDAVRIFDSILNILMPYSHVIDTNFNIKLENGEFRTFRGFRAQHGMNVYNKCPSMGGFRLSSNMLKKDVKALAALATYKHACAGINMPGAHGGILLSPRQLKPMDMQSAVQDFIMELSQKGFCGENVDVFEPDIFCGSEEMKWILGGHIKLTGRSSNACAVGKPAAFGGIKNSETAVGQGVLFGLNNFLNDENLMKCLGMEVGCANKTFMLQGLGKAGGIVADYLTSVGMKCTVIVEHDCHITDKNGINIKDAITHKNTYKTLEGYRSLTKNTPAKLILLEPCDILIMAAGEKCMPYYISDQARAKIFVEVANAPLSPLAHKSLVGRRRLVLPDIYINCGSSIASYYEYLLNMQNANLDPASTVHVAERLSRLNEVKEGKNECDLQQSTLKLIGRNRLSELIGGTMRKVYEEIVMTVEKYNLGIDIRTAVYASALRKLFWETYSNKF